MCGQTYHLVLLVMLTSQCTTCVCTKVIILFVLHLVIAYANRTLPYYQQLCECYYKVDNNDHLRYVLKSA